MVHLIIDVFNQMVHTILIITIFNEDFMMIIIVLEAMINLGGDNDLIAKLILMVNSTRGTLGWSGGEGPGQRDGRSAGSDKRQDLI